MEAPHDVLVLGDCRRQHLEGDDPIHPAVPGLVHLSDAAFADLVQQDIVAEDQTLCLAVVDGLSLEPRQHLQAHQFAGQLLAVRLLVGRERTQEGTDLVPGQEAAFRQARDELLDGKYHRRHPRGRP